MAARTLDAPDSAATAHLAGKYMTFRLAEEDYGLAILKVREIIGLMEITRVPRTRDFVRGVINLRGRVIPVVDLRRKFDLPACETTDQTVIIVVQAEAPTGPVTMGVLVDQVLEVRSIGADHIEPTPPLGAAPADTAFILGVGKTDARVVFLLDIDKVLSSGELDELAATAA